MGSCVSRRSSEPEFHTVRVVHLNGYVEDFDRPVSVSTIIGKPGKYFVCTPVQLLSTGPRSMRPETLLEPGRIYFLLPYSALQADMSPLDLAAVARKLTAVAKSGRSEPNRSPGRSSPLLTEPGGSSPGRSPSRFAAGEIGRQRAVRARSWKPNLDPIREKSFRKRSEWESNSDGLIIE